MLPPFRPFAEPPAPSETLRMIGLDAAACSGGRGRVRTAAGTVLAVPRLELVARSPADGALLVLPHDARTVERLLAPLEDGVRVVEEQWYGLDRPARPWARQGDALRRPRVRAASAVTWTVRVVLDSAERRPLPGVLVTVMLDEATATGLEARTDRYGRAQFVLGASVRGVQAVYVDPLHAAWPARRTRVRVDAGELVVAVTPIDQAARDVRGLVYGRPAPDAEAGVRVAVVDTGVGPHPSLSVARGLNTTVGESRQRTRDEHGHGTHVAGVVTARTADWRSGEAAGVELHAYRIFEAADPYASSFAIASAIKDASMNGCDLINLSIGGSEADAGIPRRGGLRVGARLGLCRRNRQRRQGPGRLPGALPGGAGGLGDRPARALARRRLPRLDRRAAAGQAAGRAASFLASFSNHGAKVALTAPGVGVVSTIPGGRWGVMSGTSMATPIATGVLARRMAATPAVLALPRDAARAAAIAGLAAAAAEDIDLPAGLQGKGLVR
ncbi:MAG: S8 family serine peptidase [Comamonadaceae bacterium]|nr:S8 family serine peptidase [Comamonadaceae bacterium]